METKLFWGVMGLLWGEDEGNKHTEERDKYEL